jgi:hypothetical protein
MVDSPPRPWQELLAADLQAHPPRSNLSGILMSRPHGGFRLAKQTPDGDEYVAFAHSITDAWNRLSAITGFSSDELKRLPLTRVS